MVNTCYDILVFNSHLTGEGPISRSLCQIVCKSSPCRRARPLKEQSEHLRGGSWQIDIMRNLCCSGLAVTVTEWKYLREVNLQKRG